MPDPAAPAAPSGPTPSASEAQRRARRRNRLRDAARLLPFFGAALFLLPDLVLSGADAADGATLPWLVYLFTAWALLVLAAFVIARLIAAGGGRGD